MKPFLIQHFLDESCRKNPDKPLIFDKQGSWSYNDIRTRALKMSNALLDSGTKPGDHVGVLLDRTMEQVISIFGVYYSGMVLIVINPILKTHQIEHIIADAGIKTLITSHSYLKKNHAAIKGRGVKKLIVFEGQESYGFEHETFTNSDLSQIPALEKAIPRLSHDISHIIYTSGSTGQPKGIVVTHANTMDGSRIVSSYTGLQPDDIAMAALPFNFDYGFNQLINTIYMGATLYLYNFFLPNDLLDQLEANKITVFAGMPPIWTKLFNPKLTNLTKQRDFSSLRVITNTGGKIPVSTVKKMQKLFSTTRIFLMYGLTEAFRSTYLDPDQLDQRPDSIGKAIPNVEIMVLDKHGKQVGPNEQGQLVHRGALITRGYWKNPEKTNQVFKPNPVLDPHNQHLETVVYSGDIVRQDTEGFIYYVGRTDHMIKTKGYRVSPTEVEELFKNMEGIADCVATGYESKEDINLRVFLLLNSQKLSPEKIMKQCRRLFAFYLVPDDYVILKNFPLTPNGKVDRAMIIQEHNND